MCLKARDIKSLAFFYVQLNNKYKMEYSILSYNKKKTSPFVFEGRTFKTVEFAENAIGYWYDVKRNDCSIQFIIVDENDTIVKIIKHETRS